MISHIIEFLVDYFTNLNVRKIFGGILVLIGLAIMGNMGTSGNPNRAVLYAIGGILLGGIGFVVIYYDIAKDKATGGHDELRTLSKAFEQNEREKRKVSTWHMGPVSKENDTPGNKSVSDHSHLSK